MGPRSETSRPKSICLSTRPGGGLLSESSQRLSALTVAIRLYNPLSLPPLFFSFSSSVLLHAGAPFQSFLTPFDLFLLFFHNRLAPVLLSLRSKKPSFFILQNAPSCGFLPVADSDVPFYNQKKLFLNGIKAINRQRYCHYSDVVVVVPHA